MTKRITEGIFQLRTRSQGLSHALPEHHDRKRLSHAV
eukprot:CAMPEP_0173060778 /NCGR_PEP_ID=MMETSP1102-20130122/2809_1 /TAXON_ID=49646 /ORGANISM="Geminigera sp., Strain Caron Lab Isolate" /LENGTH=36 /DNA_ID= /DNA_START= /DNA_END= /DNA_ORIENTATION=